MVLVINLLLLLQMSDDVASTPAVAVVYKKQDLWYKKSLIELAELHISWWQHTAHMYESRNW